MRRLFHGEDRQAEARIAEVRRIVGEEEAATFTLGLDVPELDVRRGYAAWSTTYDRPGNPLLVVEQPVVWRIIDGLGPGRALDVACGTGRHSGRLAERGHAVVGVDMSAEMLLAARRAVPSGRFVEGDVRALPFPTGAFDAAVCALALGHLPALNGAVGELARVVRPGGRVVLSTLHPVASVIGGEAFFQAADGTSAFVREHEHLHGDFLRAFATAGLTVADCHEPRFGPEEVAMQGFASEMVPEAAEAAYLDLPAALVWDLVRRA